MADIHVAVDTAVVVPINVLPLLDNTDFKTIEDAVAYNAGGLALKWNFTTLAGATTQTAVTPTDTGGDYDWTNIGGGIYKMEIPASGGASINNNTEGVGWFSGVATGVLPWRGPTIQFLPSALIDIESGASSVGTAQTGDTYGYLTTALTESYAADGAAATMAQLLYLILGLLGEKSISSTTMTVKKLDGSTTAATYTLNDATNPTAVTRAS